MAKLSNAQKARIVKRDMQGSFRLVQQEEATVDYNKKSKRPASIRTKITKRTSAKSPKRVSKTKPADDEIVFIESNAPGLDAPPIRKAAVISGATKKIIGLQG